VLYVNTGSNVMLNYGRWLRELLIQVRDKACCSFLLLGNNITITKDYFPIMEQWFIPLILLLLNMKLSLQYYHATLPFNILCNILNILFITCNTSSNHYYYYSFITLQLLPNCFCGLNILSCLFIFILHLYFYTSTRN